MKESMKKSKEEMPEKERLKESLAEECRLYGHAVRRGETYCERCLKEVTFPKPTRFKLSIDLENAAFEAGPKELRRILKAVGERVRNLDTVDGGRVIDINGNGIGRWELE